MSREQGVAHRHGGMEKRSGRTWKGAQPAPPRCEPILLGLYQKALGPGVTTTGDYVDERHARFHVRHRGFEGRLVDELVLDLGWSSGTECNAVEAFFGPEVFALDRHLLAWFGFVRIHFVNLRTFRTITDGIAFNPICI